MHHHLFPTEDTYITNLAGYEDKNFGVNEILRIGTDNKEVRTLKSTKDFFYTNVTWSNYCVTDFTGILTGSFIGFAATAYGWINCSASFSSSYFSGSVDAGPITEISGWVSGYVVGLNTGSLLSTALPNFSGSLTGSYGHITGVVTGVDTRNENHIVTTSTKFVDRTLMRFDLTTISTSISDGNIPPPRFFLNLKVANEYQLPISYKIYAFPISQSWIMGNGFWSDGGSDTGASWLYRDRANGTPWYSPITTSLRPVVDFLNNPNNATSSFAYGGGTWYYTDIYTSSSVATQSFSYENADISMDVTNIVMAWLSGSLPNNGFILMSSDEIVESGSGFSLTFYGRDTNSINSPYLDIQWNDWTWETGSIGVVNSNITTIPSGITASVQSGSSFHIMGGISGSFSGSSFINPITNFITASGANVFNFSVSQFSGSLAGYFLPSVSYAVGTISGSSLIFYTDNFVGDVDGTATTVTAGTVSGSTVSGSVTGSVTASIYLGFYSGSFTGSNVTLSGSITGTYIDTMFYSFGGFISGRGIAGNIDGDPVFGNVTGLVSIASSMVTIPTDIIVIAPTMPFNESPFSTGFAENFQTLTFSQWANQFFVWTGDVWRSEIPAFPTSPVTCSCGKFHPAQSMVGVFTTGPYSGSQFVAYYSNFGILFGTLSGSLTDAALLGASVTIPLPSGIDPYAYAFVNGPYVDGTALGIYTISSSIDSASYQSASFNGQFINGELIGGFLSLQLSGSVYTSSYTYTSSFETSASIFFPLDTNQSFTVIVKDLKPHYKGGDIARIKVFGRREFPIKVFGKTAQQLGYIVPELLPSSSFYAIKDNMSEEIIVNFDQFTRISCQYPQGNYFLLDTTGLAQERPYRILIRVENSGSRYTFDNGDVFKITR